MAQKIDFTKFIVPKKLKNNGGGWVSNEETLTTTDTVYIHSWDEVEKLTNKERMKTATDHAMDNFAWQSTSYKKMESSQQQLGCARLTLRVKMFTLLTMMARAIGTMKFPIITSLSAPFCPLIFHL